MKKIILFLGTIAFLTSCKVQQTPIENISTINVSKEKVVELDEVKNEVVENVHAKYAASIKKAMELYDLKDYANSAKKFKEGFDFFDGKAYANDRYNAASSYSLAENNEHAFYHLFRLANDSKYSNLGHITTDTDLKFLYKDKQWNELIAIVKTNKEIEEKDFDKPLIAKLEKIHIEDQKYRNEMDGIAEKYGWESKEIEAQWEIISEIDSINLIEIKKILDTRGWLGKNIIGRQGNSTLFLVIQHSNIETQVKYLPMMRAAVKEGNAEPSSLALLEDRAALGQGKRQIYGSQIHTDKETNELYVAPIIDPENVDKRRAEVGLGELREYISYYNLVWDVEKHKERTAKIEAKKE